MERPKAARSPDRRSPHPTQPADLKGSEITPAEVIANWPGVRESTLDEAESRRMFQRMLACWATDVLRLKRKGLDVPASRRTQPRQAMPAIPGGPETGYRKAA